MSYSHVKSEEGIRIFATVISINLFTFNILLYDKQIIPLSIFIVAGPSQLYFMLFQRFMLFHFVLLCYQRFINDHSISGHKSLCVCRSNYFLTLFNYILNPDHAHVLSSMSNVDNIQECASP